MNHFARLGLTFALISQLSYVVHAGSGYLFESFLPRAEIIFIGHVIDQTDHQITFQVDELLRGYTGMKRLTFDHYLSGRGWPEGMSSCLVMSQGDNHFGRPRQIVSLGQPVKGQAGYCGWMAFPIKGDGNKG